MNIASSPGDPSAPSAHNRRREEEDPKLHRRRRRREEERPSRRRRRREEELPNHRRHHREAVHHLPNPRPEAGNRYCSLLFHFSAQIRRILQRPAPLTNTQPENLCAKPLAKAWDRDSPRPARAPSATEANR